MSHSIRSIVLEDEINFKFIDPISLDVMTDPVTAADGKVYDRETITAWFEQQRRSGRPLTSPLINTPMTSDVLIPNVELKREIDLFKVSKSNTFSIEDIKFTLSSDFYQELDRLSHCDLLKQLDLKPPQIIVLGNESHGKSTLLERLIGLPIFPRDKGICTRCPIRVQLRRTNGEKPVISEISIVERKPAVRTNNTNNADSTRSPIQAEFATYGDQRLSVNESQGLRGISQFLDRQSTNPRTPQSARMAGSNSPPPPQSSTGSSRTNSAFYQPTFAALDRMREVIQEKMNQLVAEQPSKMIIDNREIVVQLHLPYCMNLDLLDLPGLVAANPTNTSQDLPKTTKQLALDIIESEKDFSFFVLVNDIHTHCNQSRGCELIQQCHLEEKTVGIYTKIDVFYSEDGEDIDDVYRHLECQYPFSFRVKHGWMATASRPAPKPSTALRSTPTASARSNPASDTNANHVGAQELLKLQQMDTAEMTVLESRFAELIETQKVGMNAIRQKVQYLYESFIVKEWIPKIKEYLERDLKAAMKENTNLGLPLANDPSYHPMLQGIIRQGEGVNSRVLQGLIGGSSAAKFSVISQPQLTNMIELLFTELLNKADSTWLNLNTADELWSAFDGYHNLIGFNTSAAQSSNISSASPSVGFDMRPSRNNNNNNNAFNAAPPFSAYNTNSTKRLNGLQAMYGGGPSRSLPSRRGDNNGNNLFVPLEESYDVNDNVVVSESSDPSNTQSWVVHAAIATRAADEKIARLQLALQRIYYSMTALLDTHKFTQSFFQAATKTTSTQPVKIERFGALQRVLHRVITTAFDECKAQFKTWYEEQLLHPLFRDTTTGFVTNPFQIIIKEYVRTSEGVFCALHWANDSVFHQYPHLLMDQWRSMLYAMLGRLPMLLGAQIIAEDIISTENCTNTRRQVLERIQANVEVYGALQEFARKSMQNLPESFPVTPQREQQRSRATTAGGSGSRNQGNNNNARTQTNSRGGTNNTNRQHYSSMMS